MVSTQLYRYEYRVDGTDRVDWVSSNWLAFARENGAATLTESSVLGCCLWDFIADDQTRDLYQSIHSRVRELRNKVIVPFRCDSPTIRRYMQLSISGAADNDCLFYESGITRVEPRSYLAVLDPACTRTDSALWMCSCCKKILLEPHGWLEVEDVSEKLQLNHRKKLPFCQHTLCRDCRKLMGQSMN